MRIVVGALILCLVSLVASQNRIPEESSASKIQLQNEIDSDPFDSSRDEDSQEETEKAGPSSFSRILSSVIQIPMQVFRAFNSFISSAPFSRLRDEMRSLNISYPKNN